MLYQLLAIFFSGVFIPKVVANGLTLDLCSSSDQCTSPRNCYDASSAILVDCSKDEKSLCVCAPRIPQYCNYHDDCQSGELCGRTLTSSSSCMSTAAISLSDNLFSVTDTPPTVPVPSGEQPTLWSLIGNKNVGELCTKPLDCKTGNYCFSFQSTSTMCQHPLDVCRCIPRGSGEKCFKSSDCFPLSCVSVNYSEPICLESDIIKNISDVSFSVINFNTDTASPSKGVSSSSISATTPSSSYNWRPSKSTVVINLNQTKIPNETATVFSSSVPSYSLHNNTGEPTIMYSILPTPTFSSIYTESPVPSSTPTKMSADASNGSYPGSHMYPKNATQTFENFQTMLTNVPDYPTITGSPSLQPSAFSTAIDESSPIQQTEESNEIYSSGLQTPETNESLIFICIAMKHLQNFRQSELVYSKSHSADVLCDPNGSCATPNHLVVYYGKAMKMSTYCKFYVKMARCSKHKLLVNSPKYKNRQLVHSNSESLFFTAHAARYGSLFEEKFLRLIIWLGF